MTKKDKEIKEEAPVEEPVPKPEVKKEMSKGEIIYTANGPMYKKPDGSLVPKFA